MGATRRGVLAAALLWLGAASGAWGAEAAKAESAQGPTVAVLNYEVGMPDGEALGPQVADLLTARLSTEDAIQLVERGKLGSVLAEQKMKLAGLTDQDKAVEVGKLLGAQLMVIGKAFTMDKKLVFVTKLVGVETGKVKGSIRTVEPSKSLSESILLVGDDVAALIRKEAPSLLPESAKVADPMAEIRKALGDGPRPAVAVVIPEGHLTRVVVDPAVETEIKRTLLDLGFRVVDTGKNALSDWAKKAAHGEHGVWPAAVQDADLVVVGEAFSEFALRTGDLVTCTGRAEINMIDRRTGEIVLAERETQRAIDVAEATAGKTALQKCGYKLAMAVCRKLVGWKKPAEGEKPAGKP